MTKRLRAPKAKPGQLKAQWGKVDGMVDLCYAWGDGVSKSDGHFLNTILTSQRYHPIGDSWSSGFIDEMTSRGYDITTLKFSIEKKKIP